MLNETLKSLICTLRDGEFHSGEQLGKALGLTRSAIWKHTKQIKALDIDIESITNKGYRIPGGLDLLEEEKLVTHIEKNQQDNLNQIKLFLTLPSTNDYLLNISNSELGKCIACFAEQQTKGKGRRGRLWISPFAKNIALSVLWHFPQDASELSGLSLAVAIAVVKALKAFGITKQLSLKWPNDILWKDQKLVGILVELACEVHNICKTVIGIGINVDLPFTSHADITQPWTDIHQITQQTIDRNALGGTLLNELIKALMLFQKEGLAPFIPLWQSLDCTYGQTVMLITPAGRLQGIGRGINAQGHFLLENSLGEIKNYSSGETSLLRNG